VIPVQTGLKNGGAVATDQMFSAGGIDASQLDAFIIFIAGKHEFPADSVRGDEPLQQGRRKLNRLAGGGFRDDVLYRATIIIEEFI
jgi:hypothetical protein